MRYCLFRAARSSFRFYSAAPKGQPSPALVINGTEYETDAFSNVTPKLLSLVGRNLHNQPHHPLCLIKNQVTDHFYKKFVGRTGNPIFSVYDRLHPVVTVEQNFDSLLVPKDHVSRNKSDCYYVNRNYLLRAHTTAHQPELVKMGLDNFLIFGDVYRRDEIDSTHYPVFHQLDGVRLCFQHQISTMAGDSVDIFEKQSKDNSDKQGVHTMEATKVMEHHLKTTLVELIQSLFGKDIKYRWVDVYFPFTHPSWELEVQFQDKWMEVLGCGLIRHDILKRAGASDRIGWAFGIGLERIAMKLYQIPDIRLFWSTDSGFLSQFKTDDPNAKIIYKPVSSYPQCKNDVSFWLPEGKEFEPNDFFELVRGIGGDLVEQVNLVDEFTHPKTQKKSKCYRIIYRHLEKTLTQEEVNVIHKEVENQASRVLGVKIR